MSSVTISMNSDTSNIDQIKEMDKYYNDIIDNLQLNLQMAEGRIRKLQDSEFKLESEIEILKEEISILKKG
ncbi:MAG: hypothetical protein CMG26_07285 [Candidatus Marinimicrobia bacterium]|nr:hypothetical protein [Candidatus Neomarinimicrobiota bacterium]